MNQSVLDAFGLDAQAFVLKPVGAGLIHHTWALSDAEGQNRYILQELNTQVFTRPGDIAQNLRVLGDFLRSHAADYLLPLPIQTRAGDPMAVIDSRYYRLSDFVPGSRAYDTCDSPTQAYEAARQFGQFSAVFSGLDMSQLRETIPGFHNLTWRWTQYQSARQGGIPDRLRQAAEQIAQADALYHIVENFERIRQSSAFGLRVTHHDTKISNVLFDAAGKGLCVIDLDTVMPGYFISDVGDMMRTYLSPANEEETDFHRVGVRGDYYAAIREGYLERMGDQLSPEEKDHFFFSGAFLIYMQALRFLTDYLLGDPYYGSQYEGHNLQRARNQLTLLRHYQSLA